MIRLRIGIEHIEDSSTTSIKRDAAWPERAINVRRG